MKGICLLSAVPMRLEPTDRSEMVNQVLYGETFSILEQQTKWCKIRLHHDRYEGWIDNKQWKLVPEKKELSKICNTISSLFLKEKGLIYPLGSFVDFNIPENNKSILQSAKLFLNSPYLWGGRTFMGIDCSGFTQIVFRVHGIKLFRDAYQQAKQGKKISIKNVVSGDIAFFKNESGKIIHVGIIFLEKNKLKIIHASGKVRIDYLDETGIYNEELKIYTHHLSGFKRVLK